MNLVRIYVHLTNVARKFQSEPSAIAQLQIKRFFPCWLPATTFYAIAKGVADAMATLHDEAIVSLRALNGGLA